jgi:hypothetical protein
VVRETTRPGAGLKGVCMNDPVEQRRRILRFAQRLKRAEQPTVEQVAWLTRVLQEIGEGRDANEALGLKGGQGRRPGDTESRNRMSIALHWVAGALEAGRDLEKAFEEGVKLLRQLHGLAPDDRDERYSVDTLRRYWNGNKHLQSPVRRPGDKDFPYRGQD